MNAPAQPTTIRRKRDFLRSVPLFERLPDQALDRLALLCEYHTFSDGEVVFQQGDSGDRMYLVVAGRVLLFHSDRAGNVRQLAALGPGGYFGELALLSDNPRSAGAECAGETELLSLSGRDLKRLLAESPQAMRGIVGGIKGYDPPERPLTFWEKLRSRSLRGRGRARGKQDQAGTPSAAPPETQAS
ncbi:MAG: cyclic nucleotide-binding domain-containing protein [Chloroflexi bacterium]|nr:cyclic nucleotide-binding domain-containing protein [Chloroflexota bacterium]